MEHDKTVEGIVSEYQPKGGFRFSYSDGLIFPPSSPLGLDKSKFISHIEARNNLYRVPSSRDHYHSFDEYVDAMYKVHKEQVSKVGLGGSLGITCRDISNIEKELPGVSDAILKSRGKIAYLGNGCSTSPLWAGQLYARKKLSAKPIVVDFFDYDILKSDLEELNDLLSDEGLAWKNPFRSHLKSVKQLMDEKDKGHIEFINYFFGSGSLPPELCEVDLAVNCYGPPSSSIDEQLSILAPGGELYVTLNGKRISELKDPYQVKIMDTYGGKQASVVRYLPANLAYRN